MGLQHTSLGSEQFLNGTSAHITLFSAFHSFTERVLRE